MDKLVCPNCMKEFTAPAWEERKFCCHHCSVEYNKTVMVENLNRSRDVGYETLVIWEHELQDPNFVMKKILGFLEVERAK